MLKRTLSFEIVRGVTHHFVAAARNACLISAPAATLCVAAGIALAQPAPQLAPFRAEGARDVVPDKYIVVFKSSTASLEVRPGVPRDPVAAAQSRTAQQRLTALGAKLGFVYNSALTGFSVNMPANLVRAARALPGVAWVEPEQKVTIQTVELNPPAGLDRTSERLLPLDNRYTFNQTGMGVNAYVIDTGIRTTHTEFGGRASGAVTEIMDGNGTNDCHGHGTHVAGTIGGATFGIAKQVTLHAVRVLDCTGSGTTAGVIAGVDWVTANAVHPAVANMSLGGGMSAAENMAVANAVAAGITVIVAAGNSSSDACLFSPSSEPSAITVGALDPRNDTEAGFSNTGTCLDLFGPGVNILSAGIANDTATAILSGTSQATPHVSGVAALILQTNPAATPANVLAAIHHADDVAATPGWPGIVNLAANSPNELLHWGSAANDGFNDGDPHLVTVDGTHLNFQGAGEYVYLREGGTEIQTRETPVQTDATFLGPDPYDGIASCVSLNTAVAVRVAGHRVTFEPNVSGRPDPSGMQLRVDGTLTALGAGGLSFGAGARVVPSPAQGGIEIDFPDGTVLIATPNWWASQSLWYLNIDVFHTTATSGIMGSIAAGSWLPALPNGSSVGPMPAAVHQRYVVLYQQFGSAWRVTNASTLFDYKPGTSTATFTVPAWPMENPPCRVHGSSTQPARSVAPQLAQTICRPVEDRKLNNDCIFDVTLTGEKGFVKLYRITQQLRTGLTRTDLSDDMNRRPDRRAVTFTATVTHASASTTALSGSVQFTRDGEAVGKPLKLDADGRAKWTTPDIKVLDHKIGARFIPDLQSGLLPSAAIDESHMSFAQ